MLINPDILEHRLNKARSVNQFYMVKLVALKQLALMIGMYDSNPFEKGVKPYELDTIKDLVQRMYIMGMPAYFYQANALLLDYYFPQWRTVVNSRAISHIATRGGKEYSNWKKSVLNRDDWTCQDCGSKNNVQAHHIADWANHIELRVEIDNGVTLCGECHHKYHHWMGAGMFKTESKNKALKN